MAKSEKALPKDVDTSDLPSKEDEMLPDRGRQMKPPRTGGEVPDTAGKHGALAPESARGLDEP